MYSSDTGHKDMTTLSQPWVLQNIFLGISFPVNNEHGKKRINSNSVRSTLFPPASATVLGTLPGQPAPLSTQDGNLEGSPFIPSPPTFYCSARPLNFTSKQPSINPSAHLLSWAEVCPQEKSPAVVLTPRASGGYLSGERFFTETIGLK